MAHFRQKGLLARFHKTRCTTKQRSRVLSLEAVKQCNAAGQAILRLDLTGMSAFWSSEELGLVGPEAALKRYFERTMAGVQPYWKHPRRRKEGLWNHLRSSFVLRNKASNAMMRKPMNRKDHALCKAPRRLITRNDHAHLAKETDLE